jgi:hypothetical protein
MRRQAMIDMKRAQAVAQPEGGCGMQQDDRIAAPGKADADAVGRPEPGFEEAGYRGRWTILVPVP